MMRTTVAQLLLALLALAAVAQGVVVNKSVKRMIDLTKHVVRIQTDIEFVDVEQDTHEYSFALAKHMSARLAHVTAKCGKHTTCEVVRAADAAASKSGKLANLVDMFTVVLQPAVAAGEVGHIKLNAFFTRVLTPFPAAVTQEEDQLVVFEDGHLLSSPYASETQTTKVKLPSGRIESYSSVSPVVHKGSQLTYGPYTDVAPFTLANNSLHVHFKNHAPFLTVTNLIKEIEVSMWGRVSVEEVYDLEHTGATLKGGFSRLDYTVKGARGASFYDMHARLPREAVNVYYRDQIGNVSTSRLRPTATSQELMFKPRFPLFGGWKTQWYLGYSVPTHTVLTRGGAASRATSTSGAERFKLEMDLSTSLDEAAVDELMLKVILPEGASNVQVTVPFEVDAQSRTSRQTYLDTPLMGRPVLVLRKSNVVAAHNVPIEVTFEFAPSFMLHEPMLLVGGFLAFFVVCMVLFRCDLSLVTKPTKAAAKSKTE